MSRIDVISRTRIFNQAAPGANTNILTTNITPAREVTAFRIGVALTTTSVFNVTATDGTTTFTWGLRESVALTSGDLFNFTFNVNDNLAYNFQVETDSVIQFLQIEEIVGGVI